MFCKFALSITIIGITSICLPLSAEEHTIQITTGEWPPYISETLPNKGFVSHIVKEAFAMENINVVYAFYPWERAFILVANGKETASIAWSFSEKRAAHVLYSTSSIGTNRQVFFYLKDRSFHWQYPSDLVGKRLGGIRGYYHVDYLKSLQASGFDLHLDPALTEGKNIYKLLKRRIDAFPCDEQVCQFILSNQFSAMQRDLITYAKKPLMSHPIYLVVSPHSPKAQFWLDAFEAGLEKLKMSGRYAEISSALSSGPVAVDTQYQQQ